MNRHRNTAVTGTSTLISGAPPSAHVVGGYGGVFFKAMPYCEAISRLRQIAHVQIHMALDEKGYYLMHKERCRVESTYLSLSALRCHCCKRCDA